MERTLLQSEEEVSGLKNARWITKEQLYMIEELIQSSGGKIILGEYPRSIHAYGPTIYEFNDEPFTIMNKVSKRDRKFIGWIFPSRKHALQIQEAGIINFNLDNEEPQNA